MATTKSTPAPIGKAETADESLPMEIRVAKRAMYLGEDRPRRTEIEIACIELRTRAPIFTQDIPLEGDSIVYCDLLGYRSEGATMDEAAKNWIDERLE